MSTLADWRPVYSGKVRELYIPKEASSVVDASQLLVVATDRVSAFDHILRPEIPGKGIVLTALTNWWFDRFPDIPNHRLGVSPPGELTARSMVVKPLEMIPIECVVRGYLTGSGWQEYRATGSVCGVKLPAGLSNGDRLPEPIFTPATKAALGDHDENITLEQAAAIVGTETAQQIRAISLDLYSRAHEIASQRGVVLADTKLEFGRNRETGTITLGDEVLTSDSSRYWDQEIYSQGGINRLDSFDKQLIRDWLRAHWDRTGEPPELPDALVQITVARYLELYERLTGVPLNHEPSH